jgi:very-short-patch-repair endonuclease
VLDFYCAESRLAIEIDGPSHYFGERPNRDARRDQWLKQRDIKIVRIPAHELMRSFDDVTDSIFRLAADLGLKNAPSTALSGGPPPPLRGGG